MLEIKVNEKNFKTEVLDSQLPALVDFWAEWCGPCKVLGPIISEIARENQGKIKICKVNVDENNSLASAYGIMSIPTIKVFKAGKVVSEMIGAAPKAVILDKLKGII